MLRYIKSFFVEEPKEKFQSSEDPVAQTLTEEQSVMPGNYKLQQYSTSTDHAFFKDYRNFLEGTRKERSNDEVSPTFTQLTMNGFGNGSGGAAARVIGQDTRNYQRDNCATARKY